jgi:hypothetical protein
MIYLLAASLLLLTILVLIIAVRQKFRVWILVFIIPFLVFNIGFSYHTINELWGYPKQGYPMEEVELLAFKVEKPTVFIMVREQSGRTRLYAIPYTKKTEEELESAGKQIKKGQRMMIKNKGRKDDQESKFELYSWKPADVMPKEMK